MIFVCPTCGLPCDLRARKDGTIWTEYWGHRKPHDEFTLVTACCGAEDYTEMDVLEAENKYGYIPNSSRIIYPGEE